MFEPAEEVLAEEWDAGEEECVGRGGEAEEAVCLAGVDVEFGKAQGGEDGDGESTVDEPVGGDATEEVYYEEGGEYAKGDHVGERVELSAYG